MSRPEISNQELGIRLFAICYLLFADFSGGKI